MNFNESRKFLKQHGYIVRTLSFGHYAVEIGMDSLVNAQTGEVIEPGDLCKVRLTTDEVKKAAAALQETLSH